ncbi:MAG: restriction endonuclease subunit S [Negativicutes bacterium]|nr:restriction endonuclease subunit S [Negativicutes bacterium]
MREMKDSGVEWIGKVPAAWDILPVKRFFRNVKRVAGSAVDEYERLSLTMNGVLKRSKEDSDGLQPEKFEGYQILQENELVFKLIDLENVKTSRVGLSPYTGLVSPAYIVLTNQQKDNRFFYYWFMFMYYNEVFNHLGGDGVRSALNAKDMMALPIASISESTMKCIADYLDDKCAKIDAIIARQQEVIEKLRAYKLSVITEAVTKGLDPNVPMKDSGIEWIGEIPEHWRITKLGHIFSFLGGYAFNSELYTSEGNNQVVRIGNVKNYKLMLETNPVYISDTTASETEKFKLQAGNILFTMTGTKGKRDYFYTHLLTENDVNNINLYLNQRVGCLLPKDGIFAGYFNYLLKDNRILDSIFIFETGTANQGNLGIESIKRTVLQYPPINEQKNISDYLDSKCTKIDDAISKKQATIERLVQYKKSLIYEVVTGKMEV